MIEDWDREAIRRGFPSERRMFEFLYGEENWSISDLAAWLECGTATVSRRIDNLGITKRLRGGDNNHGNQTYKLTHLDQRVVCTRPLDDLVSLTGISRSMWYKYRRKKGTSSGILHPLPSSGAEPLQHAVKDSSSPSASQQSEVHRVLPAEG